jgi:hypothetical protein
MTTSGGDIFVEPSLKTNLNVWVRSLAECALEGESEESREKTPDNAANA